MQRWVEEILEERERLSRAMAEFGFVERVFPSDANFLLLKVENPRGLYSYLVTKGIIVRDRSSVPLCQGCLRITVGTSGENSLLLDAMKKYELEKEKSKS
jgi:histidinol-phosphate aminotransferase